MTKPLRILLIDDLTLVRRGIRMVLEAAPGIAVVGEASDALRGLSLATKLRPDVVVTDLLLPEGGGFSLLSSLGGALPPVPVVILAGYSDGGFAAKAWRLGAAGYVRKSGTPAELIRAVKGAAKGVRHRAAPLHGAARVLNNGEDDAYRTLSLRERQVMHLSGLGKSSRVIAQQLGISPRTVEAHRATIMKKMKLRGLGELIRHASTHCLLPSVDYEVPSPAIQARKPR